jgi:hypothetical protein
MIDLSTLNMTEIVRLQSQLQQELRRRFERSLLMAFSDIVGSTPYFARFGDAVGRQMHQLHYDLLGQAAAERRGGSSSRRRRRVLRLSRHRGGRARHRRVPAGDGARERDACTRAPADGPHRPALGLGADRRHVVTGDSVHVAARVARAAEPGGVCLTRQVFLEFGPELACTAARSARAS